MAKQEVATQSLYIDFFLDASSQSLSLVRSFAPFGRYSRFAIISECGK